MRFIFAALALWATAGRASVLVNCSFNNVLTDSSGSNRGFGQVGTVPFSNSSTCNGNYAAGTFSALNYLTNTAAMTAMNSATALEISITVKATSLLSFPTIWQSDDGSAAGTARMICLEYYTSSSTFAIIAQNATHNFSGTYTTGTCYTIVVVLDGQVCRAYVNGALACSFACSVVWSGNGPFSIGFPSFGGAAFNGYVQDLVIRDNITAVPGLSVIDRYSFEQNLSPTTGADSLNPLGTPAYAASTQTITAQLGSYSLGTFSDANYVSATSGLSTAWAAASTFSHRIKFYVNSAANSPVLSAWSQMDGSHYSYIQFANTTSAISWNVNGGSFAYTPGFPNVYPGNWVTADFVWDGLTRYIYVGGVMVASATTTGIASATLNAMYLGRYTDGTGYSLNGVIDDVAYATGYTWAYPTDRPVYSSRNIIDWFGHSVCQGTQCSGGAATLAGDIMRRAFNSEAGAKGLTYTFAGQLNQGLNIPTTDCIAGQLVSQVNGQITQRLRQNLGVNVLLIGPMLTNDCRDGTSQASVATSCNGILAKALASCPTCKIFGVLDAARTDGKDITAYDATFYACLTTTAASYPNQIYSIDLRLCNAGGNPTLCDGIHYDDASTGQAAAGVYIVDRMKALCPALFNSARLSVFPISILYPMLSPQ